MSRPTPIPYFPVPPVDYDQRYFAELVRAFSVYTQQAANPGPLRATGLTLTEATGNVDRGTLSWNIAEDALDVTMGDGVVAQVPFETFMRVKNNTGSDIPNGTVVGFSGVGTEIEVSPYLANSSAIELYFVGVTTYDMSDGDIGPVTIYGKVRELDTSAFSVGDILYASPSTAGAFTNVRPTAPDAVVAVAAVLVSDATAGEIMVRPTIPIGLDYGAFYSTVDQTLSLAGTANAQAITLSAALTANGVSIGTPSSRLIVSQAGFYDVALNLQLSSGNASAKTIYVWLRKNGVNVANTTRLFTTDINSGYTPLEVTYPISLQASDYVEFMWASSDTAVALDSVSGLSGAPDAPSVIVTVTQNQL